MRIGVIADDITGLQAICSEFTLYGGSSVIVRYDSSITDELGNADVIGVDTDSRDSNVKEAFDRVTVGTQLLLDLDVDFIFKQVDSAYGGHMFEEIDAVMNTTGHAKSLLAASCPDLGRTCNDLVADINGKMVDFRSRYKSIYPVGTKDLDLLIRDKTATGIYAANISSNTDLTNLSEFIVSNGIPLAAGSVGLASALSRYLFIKSLNVSGKLIVIGSHQNETREQVDFIKTILPIDAFNYVNYDDTEFDIFKVAGNINRSILEHGYSVLVTNSFSAQSKTISAERYHALNKVLTKLSTMLDKGAISGMYIAGGATSEIFINQLFDCKYISNVEMVSSGVSSSILNLTSGKKVHIIIQAGKWGKHNSILYGLHLLEGKTQ
ncbi:four-carbon acid sugar kinase family protein [Vibrio mediterranei]|uniref:four-carbon acid sugar kinase family protein n=1 Tax=Vibrio mediterranei TaxID=689 RepID=UPI00148D88E5|nr:four-carbon acid sugar kinase family protein [Vibrio mediterranei]NOI23808.1 hypothetical protein [Vibrio mediterranei]